MKITVYGLPTCETTTKARKLLAGAGHEITFRDMRSPPLSEAELTEFIHEFGDNLVNKNSTTWRGLNDWMRESPAESQLAANPALMKRPVIRAADKLYLGWDDKIRSVFCP
jgi:arsenate reductase (glutaredoxin)